MAKRKRKGRRYPKTGKWKDAGDCVYDDLTLALRDSANAGGSKDKESGDAWGAALRAIKNARGDRS